MSLTLKKGDDACPIAIVKGGDDDGQKIYLSDKPVAESTSKLAKSSFERLTIDDGIFQQIPNTCKEREVGLIVGASGSGKSTYIRKYCQEYRKTFRNRPIFLISNLAEDESLAELKINRIKVDEDLVDEPLTLEDFGKDGCLVVFDDIDGMKKDIKKAVYDLLEVILFQGRHYNISAIVTSHMSNGPEMKKILLEAHWFTYFPWGTTRSTIYVLEHYIGIDPKQVHKVKATKSRWATVFKNFPQAVLTEKNIFLLANEI